MFLKATTWKESLIEALAGDCNSVLICGMFIPEVKREFSWANNALGGFHNAFQAMFDRVHPNFWRFVRGLKREAALQLGLLTQA